MAEVFAAAEMTRGKAYYHIRRRQCLRDHSRQTLGGILDIGRRPRASKGRGDAGGAVGNAGVGPGRDQWQYGNIRRSCATENDEADVQKSRFCSGCTKPVPGWIRQAGCKTRRGEVSCWRGALNHKVAGLRRTV